MELCESGDGMKKISKLHEDPIHTKPKMEKKRKRIGVSADNKTKHTKPQAKKKRKRMSRSVDNKTKHTKQKAKKKKREHKSVFGDGPVLYDRDGTRCDDKAMDILNGATSLALEVHNKTHAMKYTLVELVRATGNLSAGSMVDLEFTAKPRPLVLNGDTSPKPLRARVSSTHKYVESVEVVVPAVD